MKVEPITDALVATLVHPDRQAIVWTVAYSADGTKLFAAGYPSGIVQVFDANTHQELRRINTPPGLRGSGDYALLTPDWKTLYVPVEVRKVKTVEKDGKRVSRVEQSGQIRVWDVATGEDQPALQPPEGYSPGFARLSPDGRMLVCIEHPGYSTDDVVRPQDVTVVWDLKTRTRRVLAPGSWFRRSRRTAKHWCSGRPKPRQAACGCSMSRRSRNWPDSTPRKRTVPSPWGSHPTAGSHQTEVSWPYPSAARKAAPREVWFRDARRWPNRGRFVGEGDPDDYGWGGGRFTPDGQRYVILGVKGKVVVWDVGGKKVERTFDLEGNPQALAVSPDGKMLAVPWRPKSEADGLRDRNPDPQDFPQPRVTLFDLTGKAPPRTLVLRHGFMGGVVFRRTARRWRSARSGGVHLLDLTK